MVSHFTRCGALTAALIALTPAPSRSQTLLPRLTVPTSISAADYAARRAMVTSKVDSGIVLAFGEGHPLDYYPDFYQMPNFEYLTGFDESDAAMMILKRRSATSTMMFVPT